MFTLRRTLSSGILATSVLRSILAQSAQPETRALLLLLQQQQQRTLSSQTAKLSQSNQITSGQSSSPKSSASSQQVVTPGGKGRTLPPYMVFRYASSPLTSQHQSTASHSTIAWDLTVEELEEYEAEVKQAANEVKVATRPLVLLFAWMLSRNSHIEKYREFWTKRGYDILTVQTSPFDLLLPSVGGKKVASNVYNFLSKITPQYDEVVVHAFSVGGYQLGEFLGRLYDGIEAGEPEAERLFSSLKGFLIDSVVFAEDAAPGLSRAITLNPVVQPILERSIATFLATTKRYTFDRYKVVESHIIDNKRRVPSMLLFSKDDVVSNYKSNYGVVESWAKKGITTNAKCWDRSAHVLHYREHPEEYEAEVDRFVKRMELSKAPLRHVA